MLMSLNLLGKRLFPFHVAKLDIFLQTGYLVCFASFVICKKATFLAKKVAFCIKTTYLLQRKIPILHFQQQCAQLNVKRPIAERDGVSQIGRIPTA